MRTYIKQHLLTVVFVSFFLILSLLTIWQIWNTAQAKKHVGVEVQKGQGFPLRLKIPSINVDASVEYVGVTDKGEMAVPKDINDVGWFNLGPRPGEKGSAVIAGHIDGVRGEPAVFAKLDKLKPGAILYIEDDKGATITFTVRESRIYNPGYAEEVFSSGSGTHLNLVTCDGVWNGDKKSYTKRLVVFTDIAD